MKTPQEIFDFIARSLWEQNAPSTEADGSTCCYRGHEGRKCAVGFLIRDEDYFPGMEGLGVMERRYAPSEFDRYTRLQASICRGLELEEGKQLQDYPDVYRLLVELQEAHDSSANSLQEEWMEGDSDEVDYASFRHFLLDELQRVARTCNLSPAVLEELLEGKVSEKS